MSINGVEAPAAEATDSHDASGRKPQRKHVGVAAAGVAAVVGLLLGGVALSQGDSGPNASDLVSDQPAYTSWPEFFDATDSAREAALAQFENGADALIEDDVEAAIAWWRTSADSIREQAVSPSPEFNEAVMRQAWHMDTAADALEAGDRSGASDELDLVVASSQEAADIMDRDISDAVSYIENLIGPNR